MLLNTQYVPYPEDMSGSPHGLAWGHKSKWNQDLNWRLTPTGGSPMVH